MAVSTRRRRVGVEYKKTEVISNVEEDDEDVDAIATTFKQVKEFRYLVSVRSSDGAVDGAVRWRIKCVNCTEMEKVDCFLSNRKCSRVLKGKIYRSVVRSALMYGSECWPLSNVHERMLTPTRCACSDRHVG